MSSYLEATARERVRQLFDAGSFEEFVGPAERIMSPHLALLGAPASFDDGVAVGRAALDGMPVFVAAQEGGFMGGAVGEVHGAKLTGMLRRALVEPEATRPQAVLLLAESGGVRLHEANAGLIGVAEVLRAVLEVRAAGIPVIALVGGANGAFGGMGIVARCANAVIMSEEARLAMSGPEVIESAHGVEEFDARDRALVWRTTGGKHRRLLGDCQALVDDDVAAFRAAALAAIGAVREEGGAALTTAALEREHAMLAGRIAHLGALPDPRDIWSALGVPDAAAVPVMETAAFNAMAATLPPLPLATDAPPPPQGESADNWRPVAARLFPQGHAIGQHGEVLCGSAQVNGKPVAVVGTCGHAAIGIETALAQARAVLDAMRAHPGRPIVLLVDTQGQRLRHRDEMLGINSYMAHLGKCIALARRRGHKVLALVYGQALSGGFVTSGLMANACYALPDAAIRVMALPAMARITRVPLERLEQLAGEHPVFAPGPENFLRMGALAAIWDGPALHAALIMALHDCPQQDFRAAQGAQRGGRKLAAAVIDAIVGGRHVHVSAP
jgi:biotin-independent malonate decarboxylase beta subunit/biotin-independent malonate decarboxylase gamma subunit